MIAPEPTVFRAHDHYVNGVAFSPDGHNLVSAGFDSMIKIWSAADWTLQKSIEGHRKSVNKVVFSPVGDLLASSSTDRTIRLWSWPECEAVAELTGHTNTTTGLAFAPDGSWLATASYDKTVRIWTVPDGEEVAVMRGHPRNVTSVATSADGRQLVSGGIGNEIIVWTIDGQEIQRLDSGLGATAALVWTQGGDLAAAGYGAHIRGWFPDSWQIAGELKMDVDSAGDLAAHPAAPVLATVSDHRVDLWSMVTDGHIVTLPVECKGVYSVTFSPAGTLLAVGAADKQIRVWNAADLLD